MSDDKARDLLNQKVEEAARKRAHMIELLAAAYLKETNIPASECELVEKQEGNALVWFFRRKGP